MRTGSENHYSVCQSLWPFFVVWYEELHSEKSNSSYQNGRKDAWKRLNVYIMVLKNSAIFGKILKANVIFEF